MIILLCTTVTFALHHLHSEWMSIIVDSGTFVGIVLLAMEKDKQ
jgi:hypothetical protein